MYVFSRILNMFEPKRFPTFKILPLALAYVGYIVLCNLSLNVNTVGFYQVRCACV
jgi:solute carrier family 35 protein E3